MSALRSGSWVTTLATKGAQELMFVCAQFNPVPESRLIEILVDTPCTQSMSWLLSCVVRARW
jgi:hypothetical protein